MKVGCIGPSAFSLQNFTETANRFRPAEASRGGELRALVDN